MPYIKKELRDQLEPEINALFRKINHISDEDSIEGILNYTFSSLADVIVTSNKEVEWRYFLINRIIGVFECIKLEFYRRLAGPYEDKAIEKNGDIDVYKV